MKSERAFPCRNEIVIDSTLKGLHGNDILGLPGTNNQSIVEQLLVVNDLGSMMNSIVMHLMTARRVNDLNIPLLKEMNKAVNYLSKQLDRERTRVINEFRYRSSSLKKQMSLARKLLFAGVINAFYCYWSSSRSVCVS